MTASGQRFHQRVREALGDERLQDAVSHATRRLVAGRQAAAAALPEFEELRDRAAAIKDHTLAHLDHYLEQFEERVVSSGGAVHWCRDGSEACREIVAICSGNGARSVTKSKSMVTEEIALNEALENAGIAVTETDLGEYILQIAGEQPSHIIAPAIHKKKADIENLFRDRHRHLGERSLDRIADLVTEARLILRQRFVGSDAGITGANFLVAETGSIVLVTNEGNADLTAGLPRIHIVVASIEKIVPTVEDSFTLLRLLARSATGQEMSAYTTFLTGPRRPDDPDGPEEFHVILLDNGRTEILGTEFQPMLRCIKCAACLNHCPVYGAIGGHAYGSVYPGPMGSVLTPLLIGERHAADLPNASSLCGACEDVCPVRIPLPQLLRLHRERQFLTKITSRRWRSGLRLWGWLATHPPLYRALTAVTARVLSILGGPDRRIRRLPFAGGWTDGRDLPVGTGKTFLSLWQKRERKH